MCPRPFDRIEYLPLLQRWDDQEGLEFLLFDDQGLLTTFPYPDSVVIDIPFRFVLSTCPEFSCFPDISRPLCHLSILLAALCGFDLL